MPCKGLLDRLKDGETVIVAEGYIFEFERRGYLRAGDFVPTVVVDHPHLVKAMYEEFVHAGSDVVLAFTYYAHRNKLSHINQVDMLEKMNRDALKMARQVADDTNTLMAGNICNTSKYDRNDPSTHEEVRMIFKEQVLWAVEEGADFIVAETFGELGEAKLALETIKKYGNGLPAVITIFANPKSKTYSETYIVDAMRELEAAGADVVGLNCHMGPKTILPYMRDIVNAVKIPVAALPVCYRTTEEEPLFFYLTDKETGKRLFPTDLEVFSVSRGDIRDFGEQCRDLGVAYVGLCCGNRAYLTRTLAESFGRTPPASKFSPDMSKHIVYGTDDNIRKERYDDL